MKSSATLKLSRANFDTLSKVYFQKNEVKPNVRFESPKRKKVVVKKKRKFATQVHQQSANTGQKEFDTASPGCREEKKVCHKD